jgi:putative hemolysin
MSGTAWFWLAAGALLLGGLLSALFHSLKGMTRSALEELAVSRTNPARERRVERILEDVDGHSTAVGLPRTIFNVLAVVAVVFWIASLRVGGDALPALLDAILGAIVASILLWVFSLVIPHGIGAHAAEKAVYSWSWLIRGCYVLLLPTRPVVRFCDEVVRRLAGREAGSEAQEIQAELMSVVEEAQEEGQFDQRESEMIQAVVQFRNTTVEQIMTPRTEVEALEVTNNLGEVTRFIRQCRHSRIPVYEESLDHVIGVFYIKDLMRWLAGEGQKSGKPFELRAILRPALFVPETKTIRELLNELIARKVHVAMVADEYGGTAGLVTLEDIVEEIFGEIQDEYEQGVEDLPEIRVLHQARAAEIDARASVRDANDALRSLGIELPESEDYDTVAGLVTTRLGRIPSPGETLQIDGALITISEAEPTRVSRVRLEVKAPEPEAAPAEAPAPGAAIPSEQ